MQTSSTSYSAMRSGEENRIYQREWRKQNREKLNRYKAQWAPANGGESIQAWRPLKHELLERAIPERPLLRVGAGIERMSKKVRRKLVLGRRPILKKFESGSRRWHLNNPGKNAKRSREWRKKHPKNSTRYFAERRRSDGTFRLITNLRTRINLALSRQNKLDSTIALLGCSARFYKKYISGLFLPGMS